MTIEKINYWSQRTIPQVYDDSLSYYELIESVMKKLHEVVDETNGFLSQDFQAFTDNTLTQWKNDGTLDTIINQNIFNDLKTNIDDRGVNLLSFMSYVNGDDWTEVFKQAISHVQLLGGGKLLVPEGEYNVTTLELIDNIVIEGVGLPVIKAKTLSTFFVRETEDTTTTDLYPLLYANDCTGIKIKNVKLDANRAVQTKSNVAAVLFTGCTNFEFDNVRVSGNKSQGSVYGGAWNIFRSSYGIIKECQIDDVEMEGLLLRDSSYIQVRGGEYKNSTSTALGTQNGSFITIDGVHAHSCTNSCISLNSTDSMIVNSVAHDSSAFSPINLGHRTTYTTRKPASRSTVANNKVYNGYKSGIFVGYGFDITITDNQVFDCRGAFDAADTANTFGGISPSGWCDRLIVKGNRIWNCGRGIYFVSGRSDGNGDDTKGRILIQGNEIFKNIFSGIDIYDNIYGTVIDANTLYENNTENNLARAEIRIVASANPDLGHARITNNLLGSESVDKVVGVRIQCTTDTKGYSILIQGNEFKRYTANHISVSGITIDRVTVKNNVVNNVFVA